MRTQHSPLKDLSRINEIINLVIHRCDAGWRALLIRQMNLLSSLRHGRFKEIYYRTQQKLCAANQKCLVSLADDFVVTYLLIQGVNLAKRGVDATNHGASSSVPRLHQYFLWQHLYNAWSGR